MPKVNFADKAYRALKHHIITYQLKPGATLSSSQLSKSLNMSQTPVREALSRLLQERFVVHQGKGFVVSTLDSKQIEELYEMRIILEVPAIRRAAALINDSGLAELEEILQAVKSLISEQRRAEIIELDFKFHAVILRQGGNRLLDEIGTNILDHVYRVQHLNVLTSDRLLTVHDGHTEILEALKTKNKKKVSRLMEEHLVNAKEYVLTRLKNHDDILYNLLL